MSEGWVVNCIVCFQYSFEVLWREFGGVKICKILFAIFPRYFVYGMICFYRHVALFDDTCGIPHVDEYSFMNATLWLEPPWLSSEFLVETRRWQESQKQDLGMWGWCFDESGILHTILKEKAWNPLKSWLKWNFFHFLIPFFDSITYERNRPTAFLDDSYKLQVVYHISDLIQETKTGYFVHLSGFLFLNLLDVSILFQAVPLKW